MEHASFDGVEVYVYTPVMTSTGKRPGMVWLHGGGWVLGSVSKSFRYMDKIKKVLAGLYLDAIAHCTDCSHNTFNYLQAFLFSERF